MAPPRRASGIREKSPCFVDRLGQAAAEAAPATPSEPQLSIPEQIEKLDQLRRQGVVTDEEFEAKKRELLDRM